MRGSVPVVLGGWHLDFSKTLRFPRINTGANASQTGVFAGKDFLVHQIDRISRVTLVVIAFVLGVIALRLQLSHPAPVYADSGRFDYVQIVATPFVYNGSQGVLVMDRRNGNLWFIPKVQDMKRISFADPVFVIRVPFEKLDEQAR